MRLLSAFTCSCGAGAWFVAPPFEQHGCRRPAGRRRRCGCAGGTRTIRGAASGPHTLSGPAGRGIRQDSRGERPVTGSELSYPAIRLAVVKAAQALVASGVVSHSGHASLSARVGDEKMLLTMEGQVRALRPDLLALVGWTGRCWKGTSIRPAPRSWPLHSEVYRATPEVGGIKWSIRSRIRPAWPQWPASSQILRLGRPSHRPGLGPVRAAA